MGLLSRLLSPSRIKLEDQVATLGACGIHLRPQFNIDVLLEKFPREKYEESRYVGPLLAMGSTLEHEPFTPLSDNVWHLDTECIEGPGSYVHIAERMRDLAFPDLPLENIRDHVDIANGDAWLEFELNGETIHWGARVKEDWIDPAILSNFCQLQLARNTPRRFTYLDLKGQDCLIGCNTEENLRKLRQRTGIRFTWLE